MRNRQPFAIVSKVLILTYDLLATRFSNEIQIFIFTNVLTNHQQVLLISLLILLILLKLIRLIAESVRVCENLLKDSLRMLDFVNIVSTNVEQMLLEVREL